MKLKVRARSLEFGRQPVGRDPLAQAIRSDAAGRRRDFPDGPETASGDHDAGDGRRRQGRDEHEEPCKPVATEQFQLAGPVVGDLISPAVRPAARGHGPIAATPCGS